ncbi:hypothetical protein MLD38_006493 [Melastoma candidum]|uniref:Uncharacterized protein n=1 Tax=Melastoma candidum TaxID=119954 RepID=A0ACB9RR27_9MYRT|nr:hypothetical protein MLD38_006493 [Melastoma candidum]
MPSKEATDPALHPHPSFSSTLLKEGSAPGMRRGCSKGVVPSCFIREKCGPVERKPWESDVDHDSAYFSSTSISSESSSGGFSSSDTDSFHGAKTKASCFAPLKLRPVKTRAVLAETEKAEHGAARAPFRGNREEGVEQKSKALKAYETLKKVKQQPVSPGGRLTSLLNSIFTSSGKKKGRSLDDGNLGRNSKSGQASTCSSTTSFSRACLNNSYSSRAALRNEPRDAMGTRSVRFCPVNVIVGEDLPRGPSSRASQHSKTEGGNGSGKVRSTGRTSGEQRSCPGEEWRTWMQEIRLLKDMEGRKTGTQKGTGRAELRSHNDDNKDANDDDGAGSCSSSDLFEIDHLAVTSTGP